MNNTIHQVAPPNLFRSTIGCCLSVAPKFLCNFALNEEPLAGKFSKTSDKHHQLQISQLYKWILPNSAMMHGNPRLWAVADACLASGQGRGSVGRGELPFHARAVHRRRERAHAAVWCQRCLQAQPWPHLNPYSLFSAAATPYPGRTLRSPPPRRWSTHRPAGTLAHRSGFMAGSSGHSRWG